MPKMNADDIAPDLSKAGGDEGTCSACGEVCHWNDEADRDDPDPLCNPCAQRIASEYRQALRRSRLGRTPEETAAWKAEIRDVARARKARIEGTRKGQETEAERQVRRCAEALGYVGEPDRLAIAVGDACLAFAQDLREINARNMHNTRMLEESLAAERSKAAERLRNIMSTCFDGSRSGDLSFQLADMEKWIPKFTSEWKTNHRRWLDLCTHLGLDALDLKQHGRVAEVDAVAGYVSMLGDGAELVETRQVLDAMQGRTPDPARSTIQVAREVVAQAERWRIDAEHYRGEASNATAVMVESLSAEVARLTGEVAATRAEAKRRIDFAVDRCQVAEKTLARLGWPGGDPIAWARKITSDHAEPTVAKVAALESSRPRWTWSRRRGSRR